MVNHSFYLDSSFDFFVPPDTNKPNKSHPFSSYAPHKSLANHTAMPEYEVINAWKRT
jgi:hypothetical protein